MTGPGRRGVVRGACGLGLLLAIVASLPAGDAAAQRTPEALPGPERVVLLHGLLREPRAMRPIASRLVDEGYRVHNLGYPSTDESPDEIVSRLDAAIQACCLAAASPLHFVTHSLGGVVARAYLAEHAPPQLGRVVMLAPPNQGSPLVDRFGSDWWFRHLLGPTAADLGSDPRSLPNRLPPPTYPLGIIAGRHALASMTMGRLLGENDGVVSVDDTRVEGMTDFLIVRTGHVQIRRNDLVADETVHFLRHGRFQTEGTAADPVDEQTDTHSEEEIRP